MRKLNAALIGVVLMVLNIPMAMAADLKLGVIDVRQVVQQAPQVQSIKDKMEKQFKPRQEKLMALQKSLQQNTQKLERDSAVMSSSQKQQLQETIIKQKRDLERQGQDYQQDLNMAQNQEMQKFFAKVNAVVKKIAEKDGYDVVLQKDGVPYANAKVDITKQVIDAL